MVIRQSGASAAMAARGLADAPDQARQIAEHRGKTHQRDVAGIEQRLQPERLQVTPADARRVRPRGRSRPSARRRCRRRAGRRILRRRRCRSSAAAPRSRRFFRGRPTTNRPSLSAAPITPARSRTSERSASTPMPARPAACAAVTVAGPMVGRSMRSSWPGLAHLTSTPRVLPAMRPCPAQRLHPFEQAVGAFYAFERDGAAADRDRRLADVERADGARGGGGGLDVAPV